MIDTFHPGTPLLSNPGVNLRSCLCGGPKYASAQLLGFLLPALFKGQLLISTLNDYK